MFPRRLQTIHEKFTGMSSEFTGKVVKNIQKKLRHVCYKMSADKLLDVCRQVIFGFIAVRADIVPIQIQTWSVNFCRL